MDAVREHRPRADQPEPVIDVQIIAGAGEARGDGGDLVVILGVRPTEPDPDFGYLRIGERITEIPEANRLVGFVQA